MEESALEESALGKRKREEDEAVALVISSFMKLKTMSFMGLANLLESWSIQGHLNNQAVASVFFGGMRVEVSMLYRAMEQAELALEPCLELRHIFKQSDYSARAADANQQISAELWNLQTTKRCGMFQLVADFRMLRYMCGMDLPEFMDLLRLCLPFLEREFGKRYPLEYAPGDEATTPSLRLMLYMCLNRLRHLTSVRFMQGQTGISKSHWGSLLNRVEICMHRGLLPIYLAAPSLAELGIEADMFYRMRRINNFQFRIGYLVDGTFHIINKPGDEDIQEVYYTRYKKIHALKMMVVCAVLRKWIYEAYPILGRVSDIEGWEEQPFRKLALLDPELRGCSDKGMNSAKCPELVTPYKLVGLERAVCVCVALVP